MLGIDFDPLIACGALGVLWTMVQAALDKPSWTAQRRRLLVMIAGAVLGVVVWYAGAYPATWRLIATQVSVVIAAASTAFTLLKRVGLIDWIGRVTPGGEPRHRAEIPTA